VREQTRDPQYAIGLLNRQLLAPGAAMLERSQGYDKRINFLASEPEREQFANRRGRELILDCLKHLAFGTPRPNSEPVGNLLV
jgi:hypothetical protein